MENVRVLIKHFNYLENYLASEGASVNSKTRRYATANVTERQHIKV